MPTGIYMHKPSQGFQKGNVSWSKVNKGKYKLPPLPEKARKKMSEAKLRNPVRYWLGKKLSEETKRKMSKSMKGISKLSLRGQGSYLWKGGITPLVFQVRHCFEYRQWRSDIFTRDNFTCQLCGKRGVKIEADHYPKMFSEIFHQYKIKSLEEAIACEEFWNINNGRTLCKECHRLKTNKKSQNFSKK